MKHFGSIGLSFAMLAISGIVYADPIAPVRPICSGPNAGIMVGAPCDLPSGVSNPTIIIDEIGEKGAFFLMDFHATNGTVQVADTEDSNSDSLTFLDEIVTLPNGHKKQITFVMLRSDAFDPPAPAETEDYSARNSFTDMNATYRINSPPEVPEPSTLVLFGSCLLALAWTFRIRVRKRV